MMDFFESAKRDAVIILLLLAVSTLLPWREDMPESVTRENPAAIMGSGIGGILSRYLTDQAENSFHDGVPHPHIHLNGWLIEIVQRLEETSLSRKNPPSAFEREVDLTRTERLLAAAFWLSPSYYPAYITYFGFLEGEIKGPAIKGASIEAQKITDAAMASYNPLIPMQSIAASMASYNEFLLQFTSGIVDKVSAAQRAQGRMKYYLSNAVLRWNLTEGKMGSTEIERTDFFASYQYAERIRIGLMEYISRHQKTRNPLPKATLRG